EFQKSRELLAGLADMARERSARPREYPQGGEPFAGWELLVPAKRKPQASVLSFFSNPVVILDEPELVKSAADRTWNRLTDAEPNSGFEPSAAARSWDKLLETLYGCDVIEARELDIGELEGESFHISTRPAMSFHGNLQFAIREAKTLLESGVNLAFFAP